MGNKFVWILAGLLAVGGALFIVKVTLFPSPSNPTRATTDPGRLELKLPEEPVTSVLPKEPDGAGNAADDYEIAFRNYNERKESIRDVVGKYYDMFALKTRPTDEEISRLKRVADPIRAASGKKDMQYYFVKTPQVMASPYLPVEAADFQDVMTVPLMLAAYEFVQGKERYGEAEKYLFDIFIAGYHMLNERARTEIVIRGIGLERLACAELGKLYIAWGKPDRAAAVKKYSDGMMDFSSTLREFDGDVIWVLTRPGDNIGPEPGDVSNLVLNHKDRCVRVDAIISLGMVKLGASNRGDVKRANELIKLKLDSPDPIERAAAKAAADMSKEDIAKLARAKRQR